MSFLSSFFPFSPSASGERTCCISKKRILSRCGTVIMKDVAIEATWQEKVWMRITYVTGEKAPIRLVTAGFPNIVAVNVEVGVDTLSAQSKIARRWLHRSDKFIHLAVLHSKIFVEIERFSPIDLPLSLPIRKIPNGHPGWNLLPVFT